MKFRIKFEAVKEIEAETIEEAIKKAEEIEFPDLDRLAANDIASLTDKEEGTFRATRAMYHGRSEGWRITRPHVRKP